MYLVKTVLWSRRRLIASVLVLGFVIFMIIDANASEAFMALCLGGVVPGTSIVLPPEVMLWSTVVLLVGFTALSIIRRRMRTRHKRASHQVHIPVFEEITEPVVYVPEHDVPVVAEAQATAARPAIKRRHTLGMVRRRMSHALHTQYIAILKPSARLIVRAMHMAYKSLGWILMVLWRISRAVTILSVTCTVILGTAAGRAAHRTWRWALPYLCRFDTWLEVQYRKAEHKLSSKLNSYDVVRTSRYIARDYTKTAVDLRARLKTSARNDAPMHSSAEIDDRIV